MTTMSTDNHPLTQRLQFIGIGVNKLTLQNINIIQSSNNYNIINTVNSEIFARVLFSGNFAIVEFCENKTLVKGEITMSIIDVGKSCPS